MHTVDFTKFLYHDFLKNFRENNFFSKEFTLYFRNETVSQSTQILITYIGGTNGYDGDTLINAIKEAWSLKKKKNYG